MRLTRCAKIFFWFLVFLLGQSCRSTMPQVLPSSTPSPTRNEMKLPATWTPNARATQTRAITSTIAPTATLPPTAVLTSTLASDRVSDLPIPDDWLARQWQGLEFRYPALLAVVETANEITLRHAQPYEHSNPCFGWGGPYCEDAGGCICTDQGCTGQTLANFTDFDMRITVLDQTEQQILAEIQPVYPIAGHQAGSLQGSIYSDIIEACGSKYYLFPLATGQTLLISRVWVSEYHSWLEAEVLALPGIIRPEEAEVIFHTILASLRPPD